MLLPRSLLDGFSVVLNQVRRYAKNLVLEVESEERQVEFLERISKELDKTITTFRSRMIRDKSQPMAPSPRSLKKPNLAINLDSYKVRPNKFTQNIYEAAPHHKTATGVFNFDAFKPLSSKHVQSTQLLTSIISPTNKSNKNLGPALTTRDKKKEGSKDLSLGLKDIFKDNSSNTGGQSQSFYQVTTSQKLNATRENIHQPSFVPEPPSTCANFLERRKLSNPFSKGPPIKTFTQPNLLLESPQSSSLKTAAPDSILQLRYKLSKLVGK